MSEPTPPPNEQDDRTSPEPEWLDEFEDLANRELGSGSSCAQIHPIIERWYAHLMENEPPESRASVIQAVACLATEVLYSAPDELLDQLTEAVDEEDLALWVEHILLIGRAFEKALRSGDLDDL